MMQRKLATIVVLASALGAAAKDDFPREWFWHQDERQWAMHQQIVGKPAPELDLSDWVNGRYSAEDLKGKIVLVDFWATWCGPCISAIPHTNELAEKYKDKGVVVVGVCHPRGSEKMAEVVKAHGIKYATAVDAGGKNEQAWRVQWWPTYAVVDRKGILRAIGLNPGGVEKAIKKVLAEQPVVEQASAGATEVLAFERREVQARIDPLWLEGNRDDRLRLRSIEGRAAPQLDVSGWLNGEINPEDVKGKVVVLDFWATWCAPCIAAIPKNNALVEKYKDQGLVIIGVCHPQGAERMAETVEERRIRYPVAADLNGQTIESFRVDGFPDYYLIDRAGNLRIADCANGSLERAIKALLAEPDPTVSQ